MPRPRKDDELDALKAQHAETAKRIAELERERAARHKAEAKRRHELVGAAVFAGMSGNDLSAFLRANVIETLKRKDDRALFDEFLTEDKPAAPTKPGKMPAGAKAEAMEPA